MKSVVLLVVGVFGWCGGNLYRSDETSSYCRIFEYSVHIENICFYKPQRLLLVIEACFLDQNVCRQKLLTFLSNGASEHHTMLTNWLLVEKV